MPTEGERPKIKGSVMLALADSKEEVLKALQEDIYYRSGIWDWEKLQIYPVFIVPFRRGHRSLALTLSKFKCAFRQPL